MLLGSERNGEHSQLMSTFNKEPLVIAMTNRTNLMSPTSNQFVTSDTTRPNDNPKQYSNETRSNFPCPTIDPISEDP